MHGRCDVTSSWQAGGGPDFQVFRPAVAAVVRPKLSTTRWVLCCGVLTDSVKAQTDVTVSQYTPLGLKMGLKMGPKVTRPHSGQSRT